ncbi:MAG: hypothetical protein SGPRY_007526 [Prymnesium sp.]
MLPSLSQCEEHVASCAVCAGEGPAEEAAQVASGRHTGSDQGESQASTQYDVEQRWQVDSTVPRRHTPGACAFRSALALHPP